MRFRIHKSKLEQCSPIPFEHRTQYTFAFILPPANATCLPEVLLPADYYIVSKQQTDRNLGMARKLIAIVDCHSRHDLSCNTCHSLAWPPNDISVAFVTVTEPGVSSVCKLFPISWDIITALSMKHYSRFFVHVVCSSMFENLISNPL